MSKISNTESVEVCLGDGVATFRRRGISEVIVANVLGAERNTGGEVTKMWLDRLVHNRGEGMFIGWSVSGAISSILERR